MSSESTNYQFTRSDTYGANELQEENSRKYFSRPYTYGVVKTNCGLANHDSLMNCFEYTRDELCMKFPEKADKFRKCYFIVNKPYHSYQDGTTKDMGFAYVFVSDWEVYNAICGYNFNGSLRQKQIPIGKVSECWETFDIDIKESSDKDVERNFRGLINKLSMDNISLSVGKISVLKPEETKLLIRILIDNVNEGFYATFAEFIKDLNYKEMIELGKDRSETRKMSKVHIFVMNHVKTIIDDIVHDRHDKDIQVLSSFIGKLYSLGMVKSSYFRTMCEHILSISNQKEIIDSLLRIYKECIGNMVNHDLIDLVDVLENIVKSTGDVRQGFLVMNIRDMINKCKKENVDEDYVEATTASDFVVENLQALCKLPAVEMWPFQEAANMEYVEQNFPNEEDLDMRIISLDAVPTHVKPQEDRISHELITIPIPTWITETMMLSEMKRYSTCKDFPKVSSIRYGEDTHTHKLRISFSPQKVHIRDALYAKIMATKCVFSRYNGMEICEVILNHPFAISTKGKGKGSGKGGGKGNKGFRN